MGVLGCGRNRFFDNPTSTCTDCSVICENMDIQGTRGQCIKYCPYSDYLTTTTTLASTTTTSTAAISSETVAAISILIGLLFLIVGTIVVYLCRDKIVNMIKTQDCSGTEPRRIHAQETSMASQGTEADKQVSSAHALLPVAQEAFADLPLHNHDLSTLQYR